MFLAEKNKSLSLKISIFTFQLVQKIIALLCSPVLQWNLIHVCFLRTAPWESGGQPPMMPKWTEQEVRVLPGRHDANKPNWPVNECVDKCVRLPSRHSGGFNSTSQVPQRGWEEFFICYRLFIIRECLSFHPLCVPFRENSISYLVLRKEKRTFMLWFW